MDIIAALLLADSKRCCGKGVCVCACLFVCLLSVCVGGGEGGVVFFNTIIYSIGVLFIP